MCCIIPTMRTTFCCQLNIVAGFLVMMYLFMIYYILRVINIFSPHCDFIRMNGTSCGRKYHYEMSLPLIECCNKYFPSELWYSIYAIMLILCIFLIFTFCYLNDKVFSIVICIFMVACLLNGILQLVTLILLCIEDRKNKIVCYLENVMMTVGYFYMIIILNSYFFDLDRK